MAINLVNAFFLSQKKDQNQFVFKWHKLSLYLYSFAQGYVNTFTLVLFVIIWSEETRTIWLFHRTSLWSVTLTTSCYKHHPTWTRALGKIYAAPQWILSPSLSKWMYLVLKYVHKLFDTCSIKSLVPLSLAKPVPCNLSLTNRIKWKWWCMTSDTDNRGRAVSLSLSLSIFRITHSGGSPLLLYCEDTQTAYGKAHVEKN